MMRKLIWVILGTLFAVSTPLMSAAEAQEKPCKTTLECAQMMVEMANELRAEVKQIGSISSETKKRLDDLSPRLKSAEQKLAKIRVVYGPTSWIGAGDHNLAQPIASTICTINGIKGKWQGGGEFAFVYPKNGFWFLRLNTHQPAVAATVMCFGISS